ncbi:hypothetical protein EP12_06835 [Alteromonas australica]|jgi:hypothetical protein|nr:hypothetical protein EP12_06835 [Alteromonas australica]HAD90927.1 hypothetical protein [Alteromonas macleodii]HBF73513.1 hypothetical protein [Alteromonas australica]|tara:strand:- start:850 stop:1131 length:282 start_codon:yes stop_codon:yes gene_type:complete
MGKNKDEFEEFKQYRLSRAKHLRNMECIKFAANYESPDICKRKDWTLCENNEKAINDWINCENKPRCYCQLFGLSRKSAIRAGLISSSTPNPD